MLFASRIFVAIFLNAFLLIQEFYYRKAKGIEPSSFKKLLLRIDRKDKNSLTAKTWRPLALAMTSFFFFAVWEFLVFYMFSRGFLILSLILGSACILWIIYSRSQRLKKDEFGLKFWDIAIWCVGWALIFEAAFSYVLLPWVLYRAKFLRGAQKNQENS